MERDETIGRPDLEVRVDFFKPSGKWYAGGTVNVGPARLWQGRDVFLRAVWERQQILGGSGGAYWTVVTGDLPENEARADYREFSRAVLQVGQDVDPDRVADRLAERC